MIERDIGVGHTVLPPSCMNQLLILVSVVVSLFGVISCEKSNALEPSHLLEGAWQAEDGTLFHFRNDGTFHGIDFRKREIWGNWVTLSETRIGFQSLLHDSYYSPQYAVIDKSSKDQMDYIVTGGTHFLHATRIPTAKADAAIELVAGPGLHLPRRAAKE